MMTDQDLIRALAEGAEEERDEAMRECIERYSTMVVRTAERMTNRDHHLSNEVTQTVFWILCRKAPELGGVQSLPGWLHGTAANVARKAVWRESRERQRIEQMARQNEPPHEKNVELPPEVDDAILRLPNQFRQPLVMYFLGRLTHAEVGEQLGITPEAAQKRCSRGIQQLREMLVAGGASISTAMLMAGLSREAQAAGSVAPSVGAVEGLAEFALHGAPPELAAGLEQVVETVGEGLADAAVDEFPLIEEAVRTTAAKSGGGLLKVLLTCLLLGGAAAGAAFLLGAFDHPSPSANQPATPLVSHWTLDETAGTTIEDQTGTSAGRLIDGELGAPGALADGSGTAIRFDGQDDYLRIEHDDRYLLDSGAVSFYFQSAARGQDAVLFGKDTDLWKTGGHLQVMYRKNKLEVRIQGIDKEFFIESPRVIAGAWHHVAVNFGAGGFAVYYDGELAGRKPYTGGLGATSGGKGNFEPILLGAGDWLQDEVTGNQLTNYFHGLIDDVAIYSRPLEADEIRILYRRLTDPSPVSVKTLTKEPSP